MNGYKRKLQRALACACMTAASACATTGGDDAAGRAGPPKPAAPVYKLSDVLGATGDAVDATFGAPSLTRREGAGEYRRYRLKTCTLIVVLYPDETGANRVSHADATALHSDHEKPALDACLAAG